MCCLCLASANGWTLSDQGWKTTHSIPPIYLTRVRRRRTTRTITISGSDQPWCLFEGGGGLALFHASISLSSCLLTPATQAKKISIYTLSTRNQLPVFIYTSILRNVAYQTLPSFWKTTVLTFFVSMSGVRLKSGMIGKFRCDIILLNSGLVGQKF